MEGGRYETLAGAMTPEDALAAARTQRGETLAELSRATPLLVVFLRHTG